MQSRRKRYRNILLFNPSFSNNVETNVARKFSKLVKKHFSKHCCHKLFNKKIIKVSNSCTDNMEKLIEKQNSNLLRKIDTNKRKYNCRTNNNSPLDGKCLLSKSFYSAEVLIRNNQNGEKYFGLREAEFKTRLNNHKNSVKSRQKEKDSELSKYIWKLKNKNITNYSIIWSIAKQTSGYNCVINSCHFCFSEKFVISNLSDKNRLMNKPMD